MNLNNKSILFENKKEYDTIINHYKNKNYEIVNIFNLDDITGHIYIENKRIHILPFDIIIDSLSFKHFLRILKISNLQ